jgi:hypothetical protein
MGFAKRTPHQCHRRPVKNAARSPLAGERTDSEAEKRPKARAWALLRRIEITLVLLGRCRQPPTTTARSRRENTEVSMTKLLVSLGACALLAATAATAQGTKWHPGHYVMLEGNAKTNLDVHRLHIAEVRDDAAIAGFMVRFWWHDLERARGNYDFSLIDAYLAELEKLSPTKRLVVRIMDRRFHTPDAADIVPDYLRENPVYNGGLASSGGGYVARLWEEPVMGRLVSLYQAIGRRYDSHPHFEGAFTEETTLSFDDVSFPRGYSHERLGAQYVRFIKAVKPTMPRTNLFLNANWIGSATIMSDLMQAMRDAGVGAGGSNVIPGRLTLGQSVLNGVYGADYRLELPIAYGVETGELGGELGDFTPAQIAAYAYNELQAHYLFWVHKTLASSPRQQWDTGILPFLRTNPPIRTRCPNVLAICVRGDEPPAAGAQSEPPASADPDDESPSDDGGTADPAPSAPPPEESAPPPASTPPAAPAPTPAPTATAPGAPSASSPPGAEPPLSTALPANASTGGGGSFGLLEVLLIGLIALARGSYRRSLRAAPR